MQFLALATDYDGTLATDGQVDAATLAALQRLRESGRKLLLVTGRRLADLGAAFPQVDRFDAVVAENGAVLYLPATQAEQILADRPSDAFIQRLQAQNVAPLDIGRVIVSTWEPHEITVQQVIQELGLALQISLNKGAVMVLPAGINKASGLQAAFAQLGLSPQQTVAIGDAENDLAMLELCGCAVAVANALPTVQARVDWVTQGRRGAGVAECIDRLLTSDLQDLVRDRSQPKPDPSIAP